MFSFIHRSDANTFAPADIPTNKPCSLHYETSTTNWYVGAAFSGEFSWYKSGSNWGDKMKLDDNGSLEIGISNNGASTGLKIITDSSSIQ